MAGGRLLRFPKRRRFMRQGLHSGTRSNPAETLQPPKTKDSIAAIAAATSPESPLSPLSPYLRSLTHAPPACITHTATNPVAAVSTGGAGHAAAAAANQRPPAGNRRSSRADTSSLQEMPLPDKNWMDLKEGHFRLPYDLSYGEREREFVRSFFLVSFCFFFFSLCWSQAFPLECYARPRNVP